MKTLIVSLAAAAAGLAQTPTIADKVVSPDVMQGRVTFRLYAPKAESVTLNGDWMKLGERVPMTKAADGVWSYTAGPLEPQVYLYTFNVDGMNIADPVNPRIKLRARTSASLVEVPGDAPWIIREVPHGKVEAVTHHSKVLGDVREVYVYTPPGYDANAKERYPVLYLMHGNNDVAAGWTWTGRAHVILDNLLAAGKVKPMLIVMPWAHAAPFGTPGRKNVELFDQYMVQEVVPMIDAKYRTVKTPANRAVAGLSMGAGQSMHLIFKHPDLFANAGLFSLAGNPPKLEELYPDAMSDTAKFNSKIKVLWVAIGREDAGVDGNRAFRAMLKQRGVRFTESEGPGAHFYPVFRRELADFLPMIFR